MEGFLLLNPLNRWNAWFTSLLEIQGVPACSSSGVRLSCAHLKCGQLVKSDGTTVASHLALVWPEVCTPVPVGYYMILILYSIIFMYSIFFYNMVCDVVCVICVIHHEDPWAWLPPSNSPCRSSTQTRSGRNVQSRSAHRPKQSVDEGVASSLLDLLRLPCCTHRGRR